MIGEPLSFGAVKEIDAAPLLGDAKTDVGVSGTLSGMTGLDCCDGSEFPTALVATAVKAYAVPGTSGATTQEVAGVNTVQLIFPGLEIIVKLTTGSPPLLDESKADGSMETVALPSPAVTVSITGAFGTFAGIIEADAVELSDVPTAFVALATKV